MLMMNSVLTFEERTLLQFLECKSKAEALEVLEMMENEGFDNPDLQSDVVSLRNKLGFEIVDFSFEMREVGFDDFGDEVDVGMIS